MNRHHRRGMALYTATVATAFITSCLALSALSIVRIERRQAVTVNDRLIARTHARSAVELALRQIANNASWRTAYVNNVETAPLSLGSESSGTVSWKIGDTDGSLTNSDTRLVLKGIGRIGTILQVGELDVQAGPVGPSTLRSYTATSDLLTQFVMNNSWYAQRFSPTLPSDANGWRVSSLQLMSQRAAFGRTVDIRLYRNSLSPANLVETVSLSSSGFPAGLSWYTINFSGTSWLQASDAAYVTVETTSNITPILIRYRYEDVSESGAWFVQGNPTWGANQNDKSLLYRIDGYYTTSNGIAAVVGTWNWAGP